MSSTTKRPRNAIHGWINFNKPYGMGSTDAVSAVKRLLRPEKIGHAGTLDPLADGVLPLALGEATKTVPYLVDAKKTYEFTVVWGQSRTTDDAEGEVTATSSHRPTHRAIDAIIPQFTGVIQQVPPIFSALKVDGKRAYDLARAGEAVELKSREVTIYDLQMLNVPDGADPIAGDSARFRVTCSKGTYIRSLARDMALALSTVGYVSALKRTAVGGFCLQDAISLDFLEEIVHKATSFSDPSLLGIVLPLSAALDDIPAIAVDVAEATRLRQGLSIAHHAQISSEIAAAYLGQRLIAMCLHEAGVWKPKRVFNV